MKKQSFSLIEILVTLAILALIAGTVGVNAHRLIEESSYRETKKQVTKKIALAKKVASLTGNPVELTFEKCGDACVLHMGKTKALASQTMALKGISNAFCTTPQESRIDPPFTITIFSSGILYIDQQKVQTATLTLCSSRKKHTQDTISLLETIEQNGIIAEGRALFPQ